MSWMTRFRWTYAFSWEKIYACGNNTPTFTQINTESLRTISLHDDPFSAMYLRNVIYKRKRSRYMVDHCCSFKTISSGSLPVPAHPFPGIKTTHTGPCHVQKASPCGLRLTTSTSTMDACRWVLVRTIKENVSPTILSKTNPLSGQKTSPDSASQTI